MNKRDYTRCINHYLCSKILFKLQVLESDYKRISVEIIAIKQQLSSLPIGTDTLIDSIQRSAQELHEQSIMHRKHVEYCMNGKLMAVRRDGDGL